MNLQNFSLSAVRRFAGAAALALTSLSVIATLAPQSASAATVATDDASNYSSFGAFSASNLGTGFGAWTLTGDDGTSANEGSYLNTSSKAISLGTKAWGFYANAGHTMEGKRAFTGSLSAGQTFQVDLQSDGVDSGGSPHTAPPGNGTVKQFGFELRNGTTSRFRFYFRGGDSNCRYDDNGGTVDLATGGFPNDASGGFRVVFRLLTADTYEFAVIKGINGSIIYSSGTRTLAGTAGTAIDSVDCYVNSAGHDCYFNSMKISYDAPTISAQPAATTAACAGTTTPAMTVTGVSTDGSTVSYAWRKRGSGWGNSWVTNANGGSLFVTTSPEIDTSSKAWGLQQTTNTSGATEAIRTLPAALATNQTVQVDMDNKSVTSGGSVGLSLQNSTGTSAFEFRFDGGSSNYSILDSSGTARNTGVPFTSLGLRLRFTLTSSTTYSIQILRMDKGDVIVLTGTVVTVTGGIQRVRFFDSASGAGNNVYFNNLKVAGADDDASNYTTGTWTGGGSGADKGQKPVADGATGNGSSYAGSATSSFTITSATTSDSASYDCAVMSGQGYTLFSSASALTVNSNPTITTTSPLPSGQANVAYSTTLASSGGSGSGYTYAKTSGTLPTGITLSSGGVISGTTATPGTYNFTIQVTDSNGCTGSQAFVLVIACNVTITISPTSLTPTVAAAYSQQLTASGGVGPYTYAVTAGSLPAGLSMNGSGLITGTPTSNASAGFSVTATDTNGCPGIQSYTVTPSCPTITLSPGSLPNGTVGTSYGTQTVSATGANGSYTFAVTTGTLPAGLSLNGTNGQITGTPTSSASQTFTITATDSSGCTGSQSYTLSPACPSITLSPTSPLTAGTVGTAYSQTITAGGVSGSFTFAKTSGTLPTGVTLSSAGVLSGTPSASGTYTFDVTATSVTFPTCSGVKSYSVTMNCPTVTVTPATLPNLRLNAIYSANSNTVAASGGTAPYTFTTSAGSLPTGLTMDSSGVISGTPSAAGTYNFTIQAAGTFGCIGSTAYTVVVGNGASVTTPGDQAACSGSTATFSTTGSGDATVGYSWSKNSNAGWGAAWSITGSGGFRGSSTDNENSEGACTTFSSANDINSPSGNALGMFGVTAATRTLAAITTFPTVIAIDVDNGGVDTGVKNGFSLQTSGGADVLQFYFLGGQANYKYNDGTERDTAAGFQRQGVRVKFVLTSATTYKLLVTRCGGSLREFNGTYSGTIAKLKLFSNNASTGPANNTYFNNFQIGGYVDNADNYSSWTGDQGDAPIGTGNGSSTYTTPTLTTGNNGDKYQVVAQNAYGSFLSGTGTLTVNTTPTVTTASLPNGTTSTAYSQTLAATGGTTPYTWAIASGSLPAGLTLNTSTGAITGTPTTAGTSTFTATATDSSSTHCARTSGSLTITVDCATITVTSPSGSALPTANHGQTYSQTITASGGTGSFTWSVISGSLPTGLSLNSMTGELSGTTTDDGGHSFTVQATDGNSCSGTKAYTLLVASCPTITLSPSDPLAGATVGVAYSNTISASGGAGSYDFSVLSGSLPAGLTLSSGGAISGTPTTLGTSTFTVQAMDINGCTGLQTYHLTVSCATITLSPSSPLTAGTTGTAYSQTITASGSAFSYTYAVTAGTVPTGLTLSTGGVLSGTPTAAGVYTFDVTATDTKGCTGVKSYSLTISCPAITVTPATLPNLTVACAYSTNGNTVAASGGTGSYTFSISAGALPTGLTMNASGVISGTPSATGSYSFTIQATDANSCTGTTSYTVVVGTGASSTNPSNQTACSGSTATFSVTGSGTTPLSYAWSKKSNAGWGNAWVRTGGGGEFIGSSTGNEAGGGTCASGFFVTGQLDINSSGGNALGMFGGTGGESATRAITAISTFPTVISIDVDNGGVDGGAKNGFSLQTSGGAEVLQFYFLGGQANYKYNDGTERDTGIGFIRTGVRAKFILTSATTYTLLVTPCSGSTIEFNGTYSGSIAKLKLMNGNTSVGIDNDCYFNNIILGGYVDSADDYGSDWSGQDKGDAPVQVGSSNSFTTGTLSAGNNGDQYQVVTSNAYGASLSSAASVTVTTTAAPTGSASQSFCSSASPTVNDLMATGTSVQWYDAATAGNLLPGSTALVDGTHYYASQTANSCESTTRLDVTVTVNTTPGAPTGSASQTFCSASSPTVNNLAATGTGILWYAASTGGSPLITSTALTNGTHYFASQTTNGCESTARFDVTVTVDPAPSTATVGSDQTVNGLTSNALGGNTPGVGTGSWTTVSGPGSITFSAGSSGSSTATADACGTYVLRWTISNGSCTASTADVTVTFQAGAIAGDDSATRSANSSDFKIPIATLLANDFAADCSGGTTTAGLSISAVTAGTGNNVEISGAYVIYEPTNAADSADHTFTYTLHPASGADATGTVTVHTGPAIPFKLDIVSADTPSYDSMSDTTTVSVNLIGVPNTDLNIQWSNDMMSWTAISPATNTGSNGSFTLTVTVPGNQTTFFFRATQ